MKRIYSLHSIMMVITMAVLGLGQTYGTTTTFIGGRVQTLNACENSNPISLDSLLRITDPGIGVTETWTLIAGAFHGTASTGATGAATGGVVTPTALRYTPAPMYIGGDTIRYRVTNGSTSDTTVIYITVLPFPHNGPITGTAYTLCAGATIAMADTAAGGTWSMTTTKATIDVGGVVTGVAAGYDTVIYTVANYCGSIQSLKPITINPAPDYGTISGPDSMCLGGVISLIESSTVGAWSCTNGHASIVFGVVSAISIGVDTFLYTASNSFCTMSAMHVVTIGTLPTVSGIEGISTVCQGATAAFMDSATGGIWSVYDSTIASIGATGLITGMAQGTDTVYYRVTNFCGTVQTATAVVVSPLPVAIPIAGQSLLCLATPVIFSDSDAAGTWSQSNPTVANLSSGVVTGVTAGTDTIFYSVTNTCGTATAGFPITVNAVPHCAPITGSSAVCINTTDTLRDAAAGGVWILTVGTLTIDSAGVLNANLAGIDTIMYRISNNCGTDSTYFGVSVSPLPHAGSVVGLSAICPKDTVFAYNTTLGGVWTNLHPSIAATTTVGSDSVSIIGLSNGNDTLVYTVTNACGPASTYLPFSVGSSTLCPNAVGYVMQPEAGLKAYPNPTTGILAVRLDLAGTTNMATRFRITDLLGNTVMEFEGTSGKTADLNLHLYPGVYFITASTALGLESMRIVVGR